MLCDDLEHLKGREVSEVQEGGYVCITMADLCCHMAETNTTV